jgi:hypothetical protein
VHCGECGICLSWVSLPISIAVWRQRGICLLWVSLPISIGVWRQCDICVLWICLPIAIAVWRQCGICLFFIVLQDEGNGKFFRKKMSFTNTHFLIGLYVKLLTCDIQERSFDGPLQNYFHYLLP